MQARGRVSRLEKEHVAPVAGFAAFGVFWGSWAALLPAVKEATRVDDGQLGIALLAIGVGALPFMLVTGRLSDRWGRPSVTDVLLLFAAVGFLPALAGSFAALTLALLAVGAGSGALDVVVNARVAAIEQSGRRLMSLAHGMFSVGLLCGSLSTGLVRDAGADRRVILAVVSALLLAVAWFNRGVRSAPVEVEVALGLFLRRELLYLGLLCALAFMIEGGLEQWSAIHLEDTLGASPAIGGAGPGAFATAMVIGRLVGQFRAHRFSAAPLMVGAGLVSAAGITIAAMAPVPAVALAGFAVAGLGVSVAAPTLLGLAPRVVPEAPSMALSSVTAISYLGFVASPPAVGAVASAAGLRVGLLVLVASGLAMSAGMALASRLVGAPPAPMRPAATSGAEDG